MSCVVSILLAAMALIPSTFTMMVASGTQLSASTPNELAAPALHALVDSALAIRPNAVLIPGDLTQNNEATSHEAAIMELQRLRAAHISVCVVPGEHEADDAFYQRYAVLNETSMHRREDPLSHSYIVRLAPRLSLIGLGATLDTTWRFTPSTLEWVRAQVDSAVRAGDRVIALSHFPIVEPVDLLHDLAPDMIIENHLDMCSLFTEFGISLVVTGHYKVPNMSIRYVYDTPLPDIAAASAMVYPCIYRLITVTNSLCSFTCSTRYLRSLPGHPNMQAEQREIMRPRIAAEIIPACLERFWEKRDTLDQMIDDMEVDKSVEAILNFFAGGKEGFKSTVNTLLNAVPDTPEGRAEYIVRFCNQELGESGLIHLNGNEGEVDTKDLVDRIFADAKALAKDLVERAFTLKTKQLIYKGIVNSAINKAKDNNGVKKIFESFFGDYTRYQRDGENIVNDLYATFNFPELPYIEEDDKGDPTGWSEQWSTHKSSKILYNGHLYILHNGQKFSIDGQKYVE